MLCCVVPCLTIASQCRCLHRWPDPHNTLGMLARQAGDLGAAQGHFEAALEKRPGWEAATANLEAVKVLQAERKVRTCISLEGP